MTAPTGANWSHAGYAKERAPLWQAVVAVPLGLAATFLGEVKPSRLSGYWQSEYVNVAMEHGVPVAYVWKSLSETSRPHKHDYDLFPDSKGPRPEDPFRAAQLALGRARNELVTLGVHHAAADTMVAAVLE